MIALVRRSGVVESTHRVHAVAVAADGRLIGASGSAGRFTYMRSSFKPVQATASLLAIGEAGAVPEGGAAVDDREVAVACGSHAASAEHVAVVAGLLDRVGLSPEDLVCGPEEPGDPEERARLAREGRPPTRLHSNCSGKHALMLYACRRSGWPTAGYDRPDHPMQRLVREVAAEFFDTSADAVPYGVDGCGLPAPAVELWRMALAYARLAAAGAGSGPDGRGAPPGLRPAVAQAARRVARAMRRHPHLTRDDRHFAVEVMRRTSCLAKPGADGVLCVGSLAGGWGLALKAEDGAARPLPAAALWAVRAFELPAAAEWEALSDWARPPVRTVAGREVGEVAIAEAEPRRLAPSPGGRSG
ncbi:MAG: asparaginase [Clostridia bacterium]|nr:asparaginase [Clostridia bacterium]